MLPPPHTLLCAPMLYALHLFMRRASSWDKQKHRGLRVLLCRWPSITEWEVHITARPPPRLRNDLYCVEWDVKLYYTIPWDRPKLFI